MSIDIQEIQEGVAEAQETAAGVATGAVVDLVDKATHPITTVRKTARRLERKGEPVNAEIRRQVTRTRKEVAETVAEAVDGVVSGSLAERLALKGIRATRNRARRLDIVGDVLYVGLSLFHRGVGDTRRRLSKLEDASQPPARSGAGGRSASPARRSARTGGRSA